VCPGKLGWEGRVFLVLYTLGCVGFFCGPVLELVSSTWRNRIPQGFWALASLVLAAGVAIFSWEGYSQSEALYASVIVGTFCVWFIIPLLAFVATHLASAAAHSPPRLRSAIVLRQERRSDTGTKRPSRI
jgi:hypothetical protein